MRALKTRLSDLEKRGKLPGKVFFAYVNDWQLPARPGLEDVRARMAPNDQVITIEFVDNWRPLQGD